VLVDGCAFVHLGAASIYNAGESWTVQGNTFVALHVGDKFLSKYAYRQDDGETPETPPYFAFNFNFIGNWCGDGDGSGPWLDGKFLGGNICGNSIVGEDEPMIVLRGTDGTTISGTGSRVPSGSSVMRQTAPGGSKLRWPSSWAI